MHLDLLGCATGAIRFRLALTTLTFLASAAVFESASAQTPVTWDGGNGRWEQGRWTKNGISAQTALTTMGDNTGGRGGLAISIGRGAIVEHDHNSPASSPGALGDFRPRMDLHGPGRLTIQDSAVLFMDSHSDVDGRWTRISLDLTLRGGTLRRTHSGPSASGGRLIFGYGNELLPNERIDIQLTAGGRIENHGKLIFGQPGFGSPGHNRGIEIVMTIDGGTLDLTGGNAYPDFFGFADGELDFFYDYEPLIGPKNETYTINFTGPGSIIVDTGMFAARQDSAGVYLPLAGPDLYTSITYQDLWNLGILQANGRTAHDGAGFSTYFTSTGTPGAADYTLRSLVIPEPPSAVLVGLAPIVLFIRAVGYASGRR